VDNILETNFLEVVVFQNKDICKVLDNINVWLEIIDNEGNVIFFNTFAENLSGYSRTAFLQTTNQWSVLFNAEIGHKLKRLCINLIAAQRQFLGKETEIKTKNGVLKTISWSGSLIKIDKENNYGLLLVGVDVSEKVKFAREISASEEKYHSIFDAVPLGVFRSLPGGRFIEMNNQMANCLGYENPQEAIDKITDIGSQLYPNPEVRLNFIAEALKTKDIVSFETVFRKKNGDFFDVRILGHVRTDVIDGNVVIEGTLEDITERKNDEKELNESVQRYSTLFMHSPISLWEIDYSEVKHQLNLLQQSGIDDFEAYFTENLAELKRCRSHLKVIDVNETTLQMFEVIDKDDLIAQSGLLATEYSVQTEIKSLCAIANNKKTFVSETIYKSLKGNFRHTRVRWIIAPGSCSSYSRVFVSMEDFTKLKEEQEALNQNENRLSSLIHAMDDLVMLLDGDGKYVYLAPTANNLMIRPAAELIGESMFKFFSKQQADDFLLQIQNCLETEKPIKYEYAINIEGREIWFDAKISRVSHNLVTWVARDITERKASETASSVMLNIAKAVNISDDLNGLFENIRTELSRIIDTSNFFIALYNKESDTISLPYFKDEKDHFDTFPAEKTLSSLVFDVKRSMLLTDKQIRVLADQDQIKVVGSMAKVWLGIPLLVEGDIVGIMVVQNYENADAFNESHVKLLEVIAPQISLSIRRKQSEQLLRESERMLRESNLTKDKFFNIIAHDLKNPFNAIIGFSTLLSDEWNEFTDEDRFSMINSIKTSSESAFELLTNLLDWSRMQVGKITYEPEFLDISVLLKLNFGLLKPNAEAKSIKLQIGDTCDKFVWADPNMINTVLRNLISNAIKFTRQNGLIKIQCSKKPNYPGKVVLEISDSGVGMEARELEKLFDLAANHTSSGTAGESGTGLGLALCKDFIEKNKGTLWVESTKNIGSTFFVALPVKPLV
jgi:PAS domain S-box-containing protein